MRKSLILCLLAAVCPAAFAAESAENSGEVTELRRQLRESNETFERAMQAHQATVKAITRRLEALEEGAAITNAAVVVELEQEQAVQDAGPSLEPKPWSPADPIRIGSSKAYMDIGLVGTFAVGGSTASDIEGGTELGGHDPLQRGFNVQGVEANFSGAVDPYFRGNVNLALGMDTDGESFLELEEAWMETLSLPLNLTLRAGQIYTEFGRLNPTHVHTWDFVDVALVNGRLLGPDGLRNPGAFLSWLAPTPFYMELILGVQDSQGETAASFRSGEGHQGLSSVDTPFSYRDFQNDRGVATFSDLLISPRLVTSFDLSDQITVLLGASAALGPNDIGAENTGNTRTEIYGADLTVKWKSAHHHGGFPFIRWQTEGMWRQTGVGAYDWVDPQSEWDTIYDLDTGAPAALGGETLNDYGVYTELVYGFHKGWAAGLRLGWLWEQEAEYEKRNLSLEPTGAPLGRDPLRDNRWRLSPNLTWYPTEFSKLRLQYNLDDRRDTGVDHSVWLQFEFILGAHAAHKF